MLRMTAVCFVIMLIAATTSTAGTSYGKAAVHVVAHGVNCKSLPAIDHCGDIRTTYIGTGDVDVLPIFWDLYEYRCIEFGLDWPADWGSCSFRPCGSGFAAGSIVNPGDGIYGMWTTCQSGWAATCGYGWLTARSSGLIKMVSNPDTRRIGVTDCGEQWYPLTGKASSGVGWVAGDNPCALAMEPLTVTITDNATDSCLAAGDTLVYVIHVENWTMKRRNEIALQDSVPTGTIYVSGGTINPEASVVTWSLGTLESGDDSSVAFSVLVTEQAEDRVTDHCMVSCREVWPMPASDTTALCPGSATEPTTWGSIKALFK